MNGVGIPMPLPSGLGEAAPGQLRGMAGEHRSRVMGEWTVPVAPPLVDGLAEARKVHLLQDEEVPRRHAG
jgi:hypothetical protein